MEHNPKELADKLIFLSENYSKCAEKLAYLTRKEAEFYMENRNSGKYKSDTAVERAWRMTEDGLDMKIVELKMKSISKEMSNTKTFIEVATNIARGFY